MQAWKEAVAAQVRPDLFIPQPLSYHQVTVVDTAEGGAAVT